MTIPDFGGELYTGLDDQGFLWMCGHAWLLLHHKWAENIPHSICFTHFHHVHFIRQHFCLWRSNQVIADCVCCCAFNTFLHCAMRCTCRRKSRESYMSECSVLYLQSAQLFTNIKKKGLRRFTEMFVHLFSWNQNGDDQTTSFLKQKI